jgi:subtilase family serine protease
MNVVVPLQHDDQAIAAYEASLNDPSSSSYEQWLTPHEFQAKFDAPAANVATVRTFVTRDGLQLHNAAGLGDLTLASGTTALVERTFGVALDNFVAADGTHFYANVNAPLVPAGVGVVGVLGLQNLVQMKNPKAQPGPAAGRRARLGSRRRPRVTSSPSRRTRTGSPRSRGTSASPSRTGSRIRRGRSAEASPMWLRSRVTRRSSSTSSPRRSRQTART